MIWLTRLNHSPFLLNSELIEEMQVTPDTVITLSTGRKFVVRESPDEVVRRSVEYRRQIGSSRPMLAALPLDRMGVEEE
jgi:flagellar protein FlbD